MKDAKPDPAIPILMRLDTIEAGQSGDQSRLVSIEERLTDLENRLTQMLGANLKWTPIAEAVDGTSNVTVRARR